VLSVIDWLVRLECGVIIMANNNYIIVATGVSQEEDKAYVDKRIAEECGTYYSPNDQPIARFAVPDGEQGLKFGSFDSLIRLSDDLGKTDSQVEATVRRLERQYLELDPDGQFQVLSQRVRMPFERYIQTWKWDEAKYPKSRTITENLGLLMSVVGRIDEEVRNKSSQYMDVKTQLSNIENRDVGNLQSKELVDILTPTIVKEDDFVYSPHLTTVIVVIPKNGEREFLRQYESFDCSRREKEGEALKPGEGVVPQSAKQLSGEGTQDKEENTLWRVVLTRNAIEGFKKTCREQKIIARDFEYDADGFEAIKRNRVKLSEELATKMANLKGLCLASWSDVMIGWMHVKAMRVFVEGVLRYGVPPTFVAYVMRQKDSAKPQVVRDALTRALFSGPSKRHGEGHMTKLSEEDGEEYYPYVCLPFSPFSVQKA